MPQTASLEREQRLAGIPYKAQSLVDFMELWPATEHQEDPMGLDNREHSPT